MNYSKILRSAFFPLALLCGLTVFAFDDELTLHYQHPATEWVEALPVGNGRLGAMVFVAETKRGWLVTSPSISPENAHHDDTSIVVGPTMDEQIPCDLFTACIRSAEILGRDKAFSDRVAAARARLAPSQIGAQGQLQEWLEDWDAGAPEQHHRHVSHLYGPFPSDQIDVLTTPVLATAARAVPSKFVETTPRGGRSFGA
jgi:hypothetical protein